MNMSVKVNIFYINTRRTQVCRFGKSLTQRVNIVTVYPVSILDAWWLEFRKIPWDLDFPRSDMINESRNEYRIAVFRCENSRVLTENSVRNYWGDYAERRKVLWFDFSDRKMYRFYIYACGIQTFKVKYSKRFYFV